MELVLLWMTIGIFAAFTGKSRGRYGFKWFVIFLLLGPLGFIAAYLPFKRK